MNNIIILYATSLNMSENPLLDMYKESLEQGTLNFTTLKECDCCGGPSDVYGAISDENNIEVYTFLLKHIESEHEYEEVADDILQEVSYYYDPYNVYLMWVEMSRRNMDTSFLFELEHKRRNGDFEYVSKKEARSEKTLQSIISKESKKKNHLL